MTNHHPTHCLVVWGWSSHICNGHATAKSHTNRRNFKEDTGVPHTSKTRVSDHHSLPEHVASRARQRKRMLAYKFEDSVLQNMHPGCGFYEMPLLEFRNQQKQLIVVAAKQPAACTLRFLARVVAATVSRDWSVCLRVEAGASPHSQRRCPRNQLWRRRLQIR